MERKLLEAFNGLISQILGQKRSTLIHQQGLMKGQGPHEQRHIVNHQQNLMEGSDPDKQRQIVN